MNILKKTACLLILCITIGSSAALAQMKWNSAYKASSTNTRIWP